MPFCIKFIKTIKIYNLKILVVRFSSIGDVVLTTPVVRALKNQLDFPEIHFLTKKPFASILDGNTNVDRIITIEKSIDEVVDQLKLEKYDWVIDLHNNLRTASLKKKLRRPSKTFNKLNIRKWLLVKFKIDKTVIVESFTFKIIHAIKDRVIVQYEVQHV